MANQLGFGKVPPQKQKAKKNKAKRSAAARKYDTLKQRGLPEFNIFVRVKEEKAWLPAGSIAVERSSEIDRALFQQEEELCKAVCRLFPKLRKHQSELEYGYRLKDFPDEPIAVATRPTVAGNLIQSTVAGVKERFSALLGRD